MHGTSKEMHTESGKCILKVRKCIGIVWTYLRDKGKTKEKLGNLHIRGKKTSCERHAHMETYVHTYASLFISQDIRQHPYEGGADIK